MREVDCVDRRCRDSAALAAGFPSAASGGLRHDWFWNVYPKRQHVAEADAYLADLLANGVVTREVLEPAVIAYAKSVLARHLDQKYIAQPLNWLSKKRWCDDWSLPVSKQSLTTKSSNGSDPRKPARSGKLQNSAAKKSAPSNASAKRLATHKQQSQPKETLGQRESALGKSEGRERASGEGHAGSDESGKAKRSRPPLMAPGHGSHRRGPAFRSAFDPDTGSPTAGSGGGSRSLRAEVRRPRVPGGEATVLCPR